MDVQILLFFSSSLKFPEPTVNVQLAFSLPLAPNAISSTISHRPPWAINESHPSPSMRARWGSDSNYLSLPCESPVWTVHFLPHANSGNTEYRRHSSRARSLFEFAAESGMPSFSCSRLDLRKFSVYHLSTDLRLLSSNQMDVNAIVRWPCLDLNFRSCLYEHARRRQHLPTRYSRPLAL